MIKAVIFDVDGVLLDSFEANLKFFQDLVMYAGYPPPTREEYFSMFHLTMMDAIKVLINSNDEDEIQRIWEAGRSRTVPYHLELLSIPEDAEQVIQELNKRFSLGIVTGRQKGSVYEAPQLVRLEQYFAVTVCYEDTVRHKPDPEPLLFAAEHLHVEPRECVYIGDAETDVISAKAARMNVIVYSERKLNETDTHTSSFRELPKIIEILNS